MKKIFLSLFLIFILSGCSHESSKPEMALEDFDQTVLALQTDDELQISEECDRLFISEQQDYCTALLGEYKDGTQTPVENVIYTSIETQELTDNDKEDLELDQYEDVFEVVYEYTIADDSTTHTFTTYMVYKDEVYYLTGLDKEE